MIKMILAIGHINYDKFLNNMLEIAKQHPEQMGGMKLPPFTAQMIKMLPARKKNEMVAQALNSSKGKVEPQIEQLLAPITGPIQLPGPLHHTVTQLGSLIGPLSMLNVGFIMAEENLLDVFKGRKIWLVTILRLIILPMIMIFCVRLTGITFRFPQTKSVLLISLLAAAAPTASSIAQFAEIADNDAVPAGKINILSTLCCIITMPVVIMIYQVLC